jgi:nucleoside-diphosphate-sugar epimerase
MVNARYEGKTVLVIGGTGFIGGRLAERLVLEEGAHAVRVLVRNWSRAVWVSRYRVDLVQGDVLEPKSLAQAVRGADVVFHCASGPSDDGSYQRTNVDGTRAVIEACLAEGVQRLVYVSSIAAHGDDHDQPLNADSPRPLTGRDYSDSKVIAEEQVFEAAKAGSMSCVVVRPTYVWGPRSSLFTLRPLREMKQGRFKWVDGGSGLCAAVHVDNVVEALLLAGVAEGVSGRGYLVTDGQPMRWSDFFGPYLRHLGITATVSLRSRSWVALLGCRTTDVLHAVVERLRGNPAPLWRKVVRRSALELGRLLERRFMSVWDLRKYSRQSPVDISAAHRELGYVPVVSIADGMEDTLAWVQDQFGTELGRVAASAAGTQGPGEASRIADSSRTKRATTA